MSKSLPRIPTSEYPKRWEMVQSLMEREALDLLLIYSDDRATYGAAYSRWLSNLYPHFEPICILFLRDIAPIMLTGPETPGYADINSQIRDIRILEEMTHPDEDYPYSTIESLYEVISSFVDPASCKKMGIAGYSLISHELFESFKKVLPGEWVIVDNQLCMLRAVKTQAELDVIRYAYNIAEAGLLAAIDAISPGVPERHVAAEAEYVMRKMGTEGYGIDTMVASGENSSPIISRTSMREIARDDLVSLTIAPRYEGYHAALAVPVLVGNPNDTAKKAVDSAIKAQRVCAGLLRDGQTCYAEEEARKIMSEAGFAGNFMYAGVHSVGVIEFAAPIFGPTSKSVMRENMVLSIDIPVFDGDWGGLRIEDGYIITKYGMERLSSFDYMQIK